MSLVRLQPYLWLELEGFGRYEIAQFSGDWSRNQIPRATCTLAVGRTAFNGRTAAKIHSTIRQLKKNVVAKVYFQAEGDWDKDTAWPNDQFVIFEGRLLGIGYQKIAGNMQFVAFITHWLESLNFSSALSARSHPANPTDLTFSSITSSLLKLGALPNQPFGIAQTSEAKAVNAINIREDLWGKAIKPFLCNLAREKHIRFKGALKDCLGDAEGVNTQALEALKRIEGVVEDDDCSLDLSCYTPPLSMDVGEAIPLSVANAIAQTIRRESISSFGNTTMWGKLVNAYASAFMFSVVPLVDRALVVPFIPGLRDTYCKEILADDYGHINNQAEIKRPIRATAIYAGRGLDVNVLSGDANGASIIGIGGCFKPDDVNVDEGMLHFLSAPTWLQSVPTVGFSAARTLGLKARRGTSSTTTPLAAAQADIKGAQDGLGREDIVREIVELYNGYAHSVYVSEALRGRTGILPGKLRFDIAPGSTVKIEGTTEQFLPEADQLGQSMIASVVRVSISIDAMTPRASTAFQLDHIRTEEENGQDATSVALHPLYRTKFLGAPLVDGLQFPNGDCCE